MIGAVFLWYDNILVCTKDARVARHWAERIKRICALVNAFFSHSAPVTQEEKDMPYNPDVMPSQQVDYVGISASIDKGCMVWRHTAEKYDKIRRIIDLVARRVADMPSRGKDAVGLEALARFNKSRKIMYSTHIYANLVDSIELRPRAEKVVLEDLSAASQDRIRRGWAGWTNRYDTQVTCEEEL